MHNDQDSRLESHESADTGASSSSSKAHHRGTRRRRILLAGFSILVLAFLIGICISFYEWDSGSPFNLARWGDYNPVGRATYGPLGFALVLFPFTFAGLIVPTALIYIGIKREKLWPLSILGFLSIGGLWLCYITELWKMD